MTHRISDFVNNFGGGLRPNRFRVNGSFGSGQAPNMTFHITSTNLPASSLSTIAVPYRGRSFKMPGNRTYSTWAITVLDDTESGGGIALWRKFHDWSEKFNDHVTNRTNVSRGNFTDQMGVWDVYQLGINGNTEKQIKLYGCWPSDVGAVVLNMNDNENLSQFTVSLEYTYYDVIRG